MRNVTLLPLALALTTCSSGKEYCDPFLEAMDCVRGATPTGVLQRGQLAGPANSSASTSPQVSPSAGSTNGPGPSPGLVIGSGPSPGSTNGPGPSAGSTNPADSQMGGEAGGARCAAFCRAVYTTCADMLSRFSEVPVGQMIATCTSGCECLRSMAPACIDGILNAFGPCAGLSTCVDVGKCIDAVEETVPERTSCLDDLPEGTCGSFPLGVEAQPYGGDVIY